MWNCPECVMPQTLLDLVLKHEDYWQQVHYVPYTQIYQYTSVVYKDVEIGLFFNSAKSRLTFVRVELMKTDRLECACGATLDVGEPQRGALFFKALQFFKQVIRPLPSPHIKSCEALMRFTEESHSKEREPIVRDYALRHIRYAYIDKRGEDKWILWYKP